MIKGKVASTDIIKFDGESPVSAVFAGSTGLVFSLTTSMSIDPVAALRTGATYCRIRVLTEPHVNPTVLDNVTDSSDIIENIKSINLETTKKYNEFLANNVLTETDFTIASVIELYSMDLAYDYEMRDISGFANALPEIDVATVKSKTGRKFMRSATQVLPEKTFTHSDLEFAFDRSNVPTTLAIDRTTLATFAKQAPGFQKTLSDVMHYPFPVNDTLATYRDTRVCPYAETIQGVGLNYLSDTDYLRVYDIQDTFLQEHQEGKDAVFGIDHILHITPVLAELSQLSNSPYSTLSTAYEQLVAYDDDEPEDVFVSKRFLKRFPFKKKLVAVAEERIPRNVTIEVTLLNDSGVSVSRLVRDVNLVPLMVDSSRPMVPPDVSIGVAGDEPGGGDANQIPVVIHQRDFMANKVQLLAKSTSTTRFVDLGIYNLIYDEELMMDVNLNEETGLIILRAIALTDKKRTSSAFNDVVWRYGDGLIYEGVPDPEKTTGLVVTATPLIRDDGLFDITLTTVVVPDGVTTDPAATSYYDTLFLRRLDTAAGDTPDGVPGEGGGVYVTDPAQLHVEVSTTPGGSFIDQGVSVGSYLYVIDAYAGDESFVNVETVGPVYLDDFTPDSQGVVKDAAGVSYTAVSTQVMVDLGYLDVSIMYDITVPEGKAIDIALPESAIELKLPDFSVESISLASATPKLTNNADGTYMLSFRTLLSNMSNPAIEAAQKGGFVGITSQLAVGTFAAVGDKGATPPVTSSQRKLTPAIRTRMMQRRAERGARTPRDAPPLLPKAESLVQFKAAAGGGDAAPAFLGVGPKVGG